MRDNNYNFYKYNHSIVFLFPCQEIKNSIIENKITFLVFDDLRQNEKSEFLKRLKTYRLTAQDNFFFLSTGIG